jgi:hypothetical protein
VGNNQASVAEEKTNKTTQVEQEEYFRRYFLLTEKWLQLV